MAKPTRLGPSEPLQIFQDDFYNHSSRVISHAPMPAVAKAGRRPLQAASANVPLNPPANPAPRRSPFKGTAKHNTSPLGPAKASHNNQLNMIPMPPPTEQPLATDSIQKKQPLMSRFKTVAQKPPAEIHSQSGIGGQENSQQAFFPIPRTLNFETYYQKPSGKRALLEAAPIKEARPTKKPRLEDAPLPAPESFPTIVDDGTKPPHSYAALIGMAILRAPNRRLTLSQIYKWISDTYSFYHPQDAGWQNSIRHNLSLNKHFVKQERPKDDPGKGNYWAIEAGTEHLFMKEKPTRKGTSAAENVPVMSTRMEPPQPFASMHQEPIMPPQLPITQTLLPALPPATAQPPPPPPPSFPGEVSSDATIPISDAVGPDEMLEKIVDIEVNLEHTVYSPLPVTMHSSPPIPRHLEAHSSGTPPPMRRLPGSSASKSRSHKRRFASMDDSGYISSLESSAMRPKKATATLPSEMDRPRIKRGRAEEEIARLRSSSYDSPSNGRAWNGLAPPSSSPLRQHGSAQKTTQMLPPLTPAVKFKKPPKPPPSVSPNTNLRLHRDKVRHMLESPLLRVMPSDTDRHVSWSPALQVDDFLYSVNDGVVDGIHDHIDFDIFQDPSGSPFFLTTAMENGSPAKRSAKRARLDRSQSTSALGEIRNSASAWQKSFTSAPLGLKPASSTAQCSPSLLLETPSKGMLGAEDAAAAATTFDMATLASSPAKLFSMHSPSKIAVAEFDENTAPWISMDDLCTPELLDDMDELAGIDILSGFERIGGSTVAAAAVGTPSARQTYQKPPLGRSQSTYF